MSTYPTERDIAERAATELITITATVNCHEFAKALANQHRTHQQRVMNLFAACINEFAKHEFDLRNQATVEFARKAKPLLDNTCFPYI
jgi:hypothetical protein